LPLDRSFVDPFVERWPVTLRCEGTVRGVGGIKLVGDDCATGVPGLYAAGDAASRERLTGAISGGGGPNSSWAIASGNWAGRAAASYARRAERSTDRSAVLLGRAGLRPSAEVRNDICPGELVQAVRDEHTAGRRDHSLFLWALVMLELWEERMSGPVPGTVPLMERQAR
jgi:succinate dehydrogenase/fumarate reductase flavoprotein subunit